MVIGDNDIILTTTPTGSWEHIDKLVKAPAPANYKLFSTHLRSEHEHEHKLVIVGAPTGL